MSWIQVYLFQMQTLQHSRVAYIMVAYLLLNMYGALRLLSKLIQLLILMILFCFHLASAYILQNQIYS